jgi:nitrate reductase gamma subunit
MMLPDFARGSQFFAIPLTAYPDEEHTMLDGHTLAFVIFPYVALSTFVIGHAYRTFADPYHWNAGSSEILDKGSLKYASVLFHFGVVLTFVGHFGGLLIPQTVYDGFGIDSQTHTRIAVVLGAIFGAAALLGNALLLWRRITLKRVLRNSTISDLLTIVMLLLVIGMGTYNVFFGHFQVLDSVAPWIRSIVTFAPEPRLMADVPLMYRLHILAAFALLGFSPFCRLIHIWSVPLPYLTRSPVVLRQRDVES